MGPPPFLSNVHVLRPSEPEKMVFANVSVCVCVCLSVCLSVDFSLLARELLKELSDWIETWYTFLVPKNEGQVR